MRTTHRRRKSRFFFFRFLYMCIHACWSVSIAIAWHVLRFPRNPEASLSTRLRRRRALKPRFARGMTLLSLFSRLGVRKHCADLVLLGLVHQRGSAQLPLPLLRLLGEDVALALLAALELAGR